MTYGLQFDWIENDPFYVDGYMYLTLRGSKHPTVIADISRQWRWGIFKKKYQYILRVYGRDAATGKNLGGYYDTREDAIEACKRIIHNIYHDPRDDVASQENK